MRKKATLFLACFFTSIAVFFGLAKAESEGAMEDSQVNYNSINLRTIIRAEKIFGTSPNDHSNIHVTVSGPRYKARIPELRFGHVLTPDLISELVFARTVAPENCGEPELARIDDYLAHGARQSEEANGYIEEAPNDFLKCLSAGGGQRGNNFALIWGQGKVLGQISCEEGSKGIDQCTVKVFDLDHQFQIIASPLQNEHLHQNADSLFMEISRFIESSWFSGRFGLIHPRIYSGSISREAP